MQACIVSHAESHKGAECHPATDCAKNVALFSQFSSGCGRLWRKSITSQHVQQSVQLHYYCCFRFCLIVCKCFITETHDGVQDMACDTFIKIALKCRRHFVTVQVGEVMPFIEEILATISTIICDLQTQQVNSTKCSMLSKHKAAPRRSIFLHNIWGWAMILDVCRYDWKIVQCYWGY